MLGITFLKVLIPQPNKGGDCGEFGHIHFYSSGHRLSFLSVQTFDHQSKDDDENDCHEGKSIFAHASVLVASYDFLAPTYNVIFAVVFSVDNNFKSPDLELHRKPPKYS